ncbi:MAG: hypothetical protein ABIG91_02850 [Patescibacteria group bacterium]
MKSESEVYRMLPKTKKILEADIERRRSEVREISLRGAAIAGDGDGWHSTTYRAQQVQKEVAIRYMQLVDQKGGSIEVLTKPLQNESVEIGHMVKVNLLDHLEIIEAKIPFSVIHILSKEDAQYLDKEFDNIKEMIVSNKSPIGKVLLGLKRGDNTTYLDNQRLQVLKDEDAISVSSLFEK